jgi:phage terminase large subunit-like protein
LIFPKPDGPASFTAPWFRYLFQQLTLPEGTPVLWAGHLALKTNEFFRPELVHLLVLEPKGNWKTTWEGALGLHHMLTVPAPRAYCGAADKEQCDELYSFTAHFADDEPSLIVRPSTREIRTANQRGGVLKVLASDDSKQGGKKQGKNLTLGLADELHAWENDNLFVDLRSGGFKRREAAKMAGDPLWWTLGKMATITTAGWDQEGVLGQLRARCLRFDQEGGTVERGLRVLDDGSVEPHPDGRLTIARSASGGTVMLEFACNDNDDIDDMAVVKLANPAPTITVQSLQDAKESLNPWHFARYRANRWTLTYESWLPVKSWEALEEPGAVLLEGAPTVAALDMARYRDAAAFVLIQTREDGKKVVEALIERPGGPDNPVSYDTVKGWIREAHERYNLTAVGYDPKYLDQAAEELADEGIAMEQFPQSNQRMCPAWADLRREILEGAFVHDGDPLLTSHMYAGVIREIGADAFKVEKDKANSPDMDAAEALAMANALSKYEALPEQTIEVFG